jgi:RNA recognition motif-containing protein
MNNIYAHNLPLHWEKEEVEELFKPFGSIVSSRLLKNQTTNVSRGVCFVRYTTSDEANASIVALNGTIADGGTSPLLVKFAKEPGSAGAAPTGPPSNYVGSAGTPPPIPSHYGAAPSPYHQAPSTRYSPYGGGNSRADAAGGEDRTNLYVINVPKSFTETEVMETFGKHGAVVSAHILKDRDTGLSRGIGFCRMGSAEDAAVALRELNGVTLPGAEGELSITLAKDSRNKAANGPPGGGAYGQQPRGYGGPPAMQYGQAAVQGYSPYGYAPPRPSNAAAYAPYPPSAYQQQPPSSQYSQPAYQQQPSPYAPQPGQQAAYQAAPGPQAPAPYGY